MYTKIQSSSRCCFCTPPQYGLLVWAYLKMIFNGLVIGCTLTWFSAVGTFSKFRFTVHNVYDLILLTSVSILFISDIIFNFVIIIAIYKKHSILGRMFYRYGIIHTVLLLALGVLMIAFLVSSTGVLQREELRNIIFSFTIICSILIVFHLYLTPLIRNEVTTLKPDGHIQFVQNLDSDDVVEIKSKENPFFPQLEPK